MDLKDGITISGILNDMYTIPMKSYFIHRNSEFFHLNPKNNYVMTQVDYEANLEEIINAIILFYNRKETWIVESNIPVDDIFRL